MQTLIAIQDKLIATLRKCCELPPVGTSGAAAGVLYVKHRKGGCFRAAINRAQRSIEALGFTPQQAAAAVRDARDVVVLELGAANG